MSGLKITDITDELIAPVLTDDDLLLADEYLQDVCINVNVNIKDIPTPLSYRLKRLLIAFTCKEVCARKAGGALGTPFKGQESTDKWTQKLPYFTKQLNEYEAEISYEFLTGRKLKKNIGSIRVYRG